MFGVGALRFGWRKKEKRKDKNHTKEAAVLLLHVCTVACMPPVQWTLE